MGPLALHRARAITESHQFARGFTLVEILVVVLVIGLAAGLVYARVDADPRRDVERERDVSARRWARRSARAVAQPVLGMSANGSVPILAPRDDDRRRPLGAARRR